MFVKHSVRRTGEFDRSDSQFDGLDDNRKGEERSSVTSAHLSSTFSGSIRHLLRSETSSNHAEVDARFARLIEQGKCGYIEFLTLSWAAVCPLEQALVHANVERILPDWNERSRRISLRADLAELGITTVPLPQPPSLGGEAHQLGVLYVLEGSRLGAKVLVQRLISNGLYLLSALRYLRHGEDLPLWQRFVERLEASSAVRRSPAEAIAGAKAAFA